MNLHEFLIAVEILNVISSLGYVQLLLMECICSPEYFHQVYMLFDLWFHYCCRTHYRRHNCKKYGPPSENIVQPKYHQHVLESHDKHHKNHLRWIDTNGRVISKKQTYSLTWSCSKCCSIEWKSSCTCEQCNN